MIFRGPSGPIPVEPGVGWATDLQNNPGPKVVNLDIRTIEHQMYSNLEVEGNEI